MATTIIPITPATLDIIEVLNGGMRPALETEESFFVYSGKDAHAEIITNDEITSRYYDENMTVVRIVCLDK